jgi:hypothetical protein
MARDIMHEDWLVWAGKWRQFPPHGTNDQDGAAFARFEPDFDHFLVPIPTP